jgi:uncharacterized surface protein with fasciclin (FAS1) repeats
MNRYSKLIPATGMAATVVGLVVANSVPAAAAPNLIGAGCADYAAMHSDGPASVAGMSTVPVAVAASNNPELTTLTAALSGQLNPNVNLVDTLNGGQFTVFAPTDAAFNKLPADTINQLKTNSDLLKSILTFHVIPGQLSPNQVDGSHNSVQGTPVKVTGTGNGLKVNNAGLVCGGVPTANAQVYMIDAVLMPPGQ